MIYMKLCFEIKFSGNSQIYQNIIYSDKYSFIDKITKMILWQCKNLYTVFLPDIVILGD